MTSTNASTAKTTSPGLGASLWKSGFLAILLAGFTILLPQLAAAAEEDAVRLFRTLDMNTDKQVDRDEFNIQEMELFYHSDANRDGVLMKDETILSQASFAILDHDKDGKVTGFEFIDSKLTDFDAVDSNNNGIVTPEEFEAFLETIKKPN